MNYPKFTTWKHKGVQFLAFETGTSHHIVDETGNNYGAWDRLETFRKFQKEGDRNGETPVGDYTALQLRF